MDLQPCTGGLSTEVGGANRVALPLAWLRDRIVGFHCELKYPICFRVVKVRRQDRSARPVSLDCTDGEPLRSSLYSQDGGTPFHADDGSRHRLRGDAHTF
jgi:hypothetical protein